MIVSILILIIGLVLLIKGADFFIKGASALAMKFKIPQIVIGLTIVAMGTSAPEASVSINSALKGVTGVAIGNVFGSNIANVLLILGLTSAICALKLQKNSVKYEMPFVFLITVLLCGAGYYLHTLDRVCGLIMLLLFGAFLAYLFKMAQSSKDEELEDLPKPMHPFMMFVCIVGGLAALVYGSDLTVNSAIDIAHRLSISDRIIGLTIVAIGTSLPELVTCVIAALKKQPDLAVGNIIGSNIFNILFVLGLTCVIQPVGFDPAFILDGIVAVISIMLLFAYTCGDRKLTRWEGCSLLVLYAIYLGYLIIK